MSNFQKGETLAQVFCCEFCERRLLYIELRQSQTQVIVCYQGKEKDEWEPWIYWKVSWVCSYCYQIIPKFKPQITPISHYQNLRRSRYLHVWNIYIYFAVNGKHQFSEQHLRGIVPAWFSAKVGELNHLVQRTTYDLNIQTPFRFIHDLFSWYIFLQWYLKCGVDSFFNQY